MIKRIHVNQHKIKARESDPISIKTSMGTFTSSDVAISGPSRLVYSPEKPLSCGAHLWIETHARVFLMDQGVTID